MFKSFKIWIYLSILMGMVIFITNCKKKDNNVLEDLQQIHQYQVSISELSGLAQYTNADKFVTISDNNTNVYIISNTGEILDELDFTGKDLEGIAYDSITSSFFIIEEKDKVLIQLDSNGIEQSRLPININNTEEKHGPEGITYNPDNKHLYIVNEKLPAVLIEMTLSGEIVQKTDLSFAEDYSSVFYDHTNGLLWILSDESHRLTKCDLYGNEIKSWNTGVDKGEGLVVDTKNALVYIVSDNNSRLYVFTF